jgi:hypothetical protein
MAKKATPEDSFENTRPGMIRKRRVARTHGQFDRDGGKHVQEKHLDKSST